MAKKKKTLAELQTENDLLRKSRASEGWVSVLKELIRYGSLVLIFGFVYLSIKALAGQNTVAQIGIKFLTDIKISEALAWALAGGSGVLAFRERRLRQKTVKHLHGQNKRAEKLLDSRRTSSNLTETGETNPEDE